MHPLRLSRWLNIDDDSKPKLYAKIYASAEITSPSYLLDLVFAAGIATLGLVLNSPAVVIGAMLVSPLMSPILASGLAVASSDIYLGVKSFASLVGSIFAAITFSAVLVYLLPFQAPTAEILARTTPNLLDLAVAVFSGLAGSFVMARSMSGGEASALPGVAIAVALMPPLCTVGFGVGSGWNWQIISGAGLLFLTNLIAIAASAFVVFYLTGMDAPEVRAKITEEAMREAAGKRFYQLLHHPRVQNWFGEAGQLRWRVVMVLAVVAVLFVPLRSSLMQLKDETIARASAREVIRALVPAEHLLSQQLEIFPDHVTQRIVTTVPINPDLVRQKEVELAKRTGKLASIQVRQVANEEELIEIRESLRRPAMLPLATPKLQEMAARARPLVEEPLKELWPSDSATLLDWEIGFGGEGPVLRLNYQAPKALDTASQEVMANALKKSLNLEQLTVLYGWQKPPTPKRRR
ncbi:MAG: DUF389 domain-containing protein [Bryobacter sp.]|nr:DUF389 domain-containing protein [Bryobacter sp.]